MRALDSTKGMRRPLEKRQLGTSELQISPIALGTWAMGATVETWGHVDDRESIAAIHQALDLGINLIDTAPIYGLGHSETIIGNVITGRRDEVILATKCGLLFPKSNNELPPRCLKSESVLQECDASLRRLRTDYIDLYQCHWSDPETDIRETMEAMRTLLDLGKIRAIGVSNFGCEQISQAREFAPIVALQPPFSMLHLHAAGDLIPYCVENDMGVLPYSPLAKGLLTGKFTETSTMEGIRARDPEFLGDRYRENLRIVESLRQIAQDYGKSIAQLAINWTAYYPGITAPIVGAKRPSQVRDNAGGVGWKLADDDRKKIDTLLQMRDGAHDA